MSFGGCVDYDEACQMPFTIDLVRLATSISLAGEVLRSSVTVEEIAKSLISGYEEGLGTAGAPNFVSERGCAEMTDMVTAGKESAGRIWARKLNSKENPAIRPKGLPRGLEDIFRSAFARGAEAHVPSGRESLVVSEASGGDATPRSYATMAATLSRERQKRSFPLPSTGSKCDLQHPR